MSIIQKQLAFSVEEYRGRLAGVQKRVADAGLDGLVVTTPENICYLSGYHTSGYYYVQALLVAAEGEPRLVTRHFEQRNIDAYSWLDRDTHGISFTDSENPMDKVVAGLADLGVDAGRIGVETASFFLTVDRYEELKAWLPNATLANGSGIVEDGRKVKSPAEVEYIRQACRISETGIAALEEHARPGITENELAGEIHKAMVSAGGEYPGLPLFLSSGWRTEIPHANWTDRMIEKGDLVFCELTGVVKRYSGPLLRCVSLGEPSDDLVRCAEASHDMLDAAIETIKPGVTSHAVNAAVVAVAEKAGLASGVTNRAGYSVGINFPPDWGEGVFLDLKGGDETVLRTGMCFHIPRSMRIEGKVAVSFSETVRVSETGCEVLTDYQPRGLIVKT